MKKLTKLFILLFFAAIIGYSANAAVYYVASNGNDSWTGTLVAPNAAKTDGPWKTIEKVNSVIFKPGDQILFRRGDIWRESLITTSSGNSEMQITFAAYGSGNKPVISGADAPQSWTHLTGNVYYTSISLSLMVSNLFPNGFQQRVWHNKSELAVAKSTNLGTNQFYYADEKLYINIGGNPSGELIEATKRKYPVLIKNSYLTFDNLHITMGETNVGHSVKTDYCILQYCIVDKARGQGMFTGQSTTKNADYWTIQHCTFENNGASTVYLHGIYCKGDNNWLIQYNKFLHNAAFGINLNGTSNCILRYNYSEGNGTGFMELYQDNAGPSNNNQIYYNVSNGDRKLMFVGGNSGHSGNRVYHNTVYNFTFAGLDIENNANLAEVRNNIFWSTLPNSHAYAVNPGSSIQKSSNNLLLATGSINYNGKSYSNLEAFRAANPNLELNSVAENPLFEAAGSDFHLTSLSPCRNAGINLSLTIDFDGNVVPSENIPDIGAYEYFINTTPPLPDGAIEAESATLEAPMETVSDVTASGGKYIRTATRNQGTATYTVYIPEDGIYTISARINTANSGTNSFYIKMDQMEDTVWHTSETQNQWITEEVKVGSFDNTIVYEIGLKTGNHTLVIRGREVNTLFDYFFLTKIRELPEDQIIESLTLIDPVTDQKIGELYNGDIIDISGLPSGFLAIEAIVNDSDVHSVQFELSGTKMYQTSESTAPYSLFGDCQGDYYELWIPEPGNYNLVVKAYSDYFAKGDIMDESTIHFVVSE